MKSITINSYILHLRLRLMWTAYLSIMYMYTLLYIHLELTLGSFTLSPPPTPPALSQQNHTMLAVLYPSLFFIGTTLCAHYVPTSLFPHPFFFLIVPASLHPSHFLTRTTTCVRLPLSSSLPRFSQVNHIHVIQYNTHM